MKLQENAATVGFPEGSCMASFHGAEMILDASGAVFLPGSKSLLVADLHLEKSSSFARKGQFLPPYDTLKTLEKLETVIKAYLPNRVITLGDNMHDCEGWQRLEERAQKKLAAIQSYCDFIWLDGNHDISRETIKSAAAAQALTTYIIDGLTLVHDPKDHVLGTPTLAGHLHPAAVINLRSLKTRRRCFVMGGDVMILPAFGVFTGGLALSNAAFSNYLCADTRIFVMSSDRVMEVPISVISL